MTTPYETLAESDVALGVECALPWLESAPRTRPVRKPVLTPRGVLRVVPGRNLKDLMTDLPAPSGSPAS